MDFKSFETLGIVKNSSVKTAKELSAFLSEIENIRKGSNWNKDQFLSLFKELIPDFGHKETGKNLDNKM